MDLQTQVLSTHASSLVEEALRKFGKIRIQAAGSSMLPSIRPGDILTVHRRDMTQVSKGDIVLFIRKNRLYVHRVEEKKFSGSNCRALITRGDSLLKRDTPISSGELLGRVTSISRGRRHILPRPTLSASERMISSALRHFDWPAKNLLRLVWRIGRHRAAHRDHHR